MSKPIWTVCSLQALVCYLALAQAQPEPPRPAQGGPPPFGPGLMKQERKLVKQYDKDGDGRLNNEERQAARADLKKQGNPKGGFGPRGPRGPGEFMSTSLLQALDGDKDGKLSKDELKAGVKQFFAACDKDKKGTLDEGKVAEGLNAIMPRPQGFPPPPQGAPPRGDERPKEVAPPKEGPQGQPPQPPRGRFGPGQMFAAELCKRADADKDGKITLDELHKAAEAVFNEIDKDRTGKLDKDQLGAGIAKVLPPPGGPGGFGPGPREPGKPGPRVQPAEVKNYPDAKLYEPTVLRTLFLDFENKDWEAELQDFHNSDVEVPATLGVDGKKYPNVGVHFRGMSSYMGAPMGSKRSLNLSLDFVDDKQKLYGYKTLNLLNANGDPSLLSSVLYSHIASKHIPAPKANLVKVVINGESWGVYVNVQQFNKDLVAEHFKSAKGARWKVPGSPNGAGGLDYLGDNIADYKRRYEIKSGDKDKDWLALIELCKKLSQTPADKLEQELAPILDIDGALWFLALDVALINSDGYWTRASDYSIYRDEAGKFHLIPHDMNEAFQPHMSFGFGPGPRQAPGPMAAPRPGGGIDLDPLVGLDDPRKPLRSKLLAVPALRKRYLENVKAIARDQLDWQKLGPVVQQYRELIDKEVQADTRKLSSYESFARAVADQAEEQPRGRPGLRAFADARRKYLLDYVEKR